MFNLITIKRKNYIRVTGIAGYMESIASLLYNVKEIEIHSRQYGDQHLDPYDYSISNMLGMQILKILAKDHDNCCDTIESIGVATHQRLICVSRTFENR